MGKITIVNRTADEIQAKVATDGGDKDRGSNKWFTLTANGGRDTWNRNEPQVIDIVRGFAPGLPVQTLYGVPDATVEIK